MKGILFFPTINGGQATVLVVKIQCIERIRFSLFHWSEHVKMTMDNNKVFYIADTYVNCRQALDKMAC